ncbi:MAG: class I SAM-dependent methyltransferase [Clostridium sp.]|nr:class I SAM-dependent methyltransferase [Clostridium sp.]MCM1173215.1 class I SAM-dependent methyltransferase [Clostridium sp.]MCM1209404.1 class I SAM-dependent methyltransferase [Ruminococcus sp.]
MEHIKKSMGNKRQATMRSEHYRNYFKVPFMMGPNCLRFLDELLEEYPLQFTSDNLVLDLGCGSGITSLFIAKETGADVYANDLWVSEEENRKHFTDWNMNDKITPVCEDAANLQFDKEMFDAVISIDSYHYFAGKEGFFVDNILPYVKRGGIVLIAIPGIRHEYDGQSKELLTPWLGEDAYMFQSADFWKRMIGGHKDIEAVRTWELSSFELPWQEWFDTKHEFALNDENYFENYIKPFTTFVGIMVRKAKAGNAFE